MGREKASASDHFLMIRAEDIWVDAANKREDIVVWQPQTDADFVVSDSSFPLHSLRSFDASLLYSTYLSVGYIAYVMKISRRTLSAILFNGQDFERNKLRIAGAGGEFEFAGRGILTLIFSRRLLLSELISGRISDDYESILEPRLQAVGFNIMTIASSRA